MMNKAIICILIFCIATSKLFSGQEPPRHESIKARRVGGKRARGTREWGTAWMGYEYPDLSATLELRGTKKEYVEALISLYGEDYTREYITNFRPDLLPILNKVIPQQKTRQSTEEQEKTQAAEHANRPIVKGRGSPKSPRRSAPISIPAASAAAAAFVPGEPHIRRGSVSESPSRAS